MGTMMDVKTCPHCGSPVSIGGECGCPGAARERKKLEDIRERIGDECHIRLDKTAGREDFQRDIRANCTSAVINGLAVLVMETANLIEQPLDRVYAVLATVLFSSDGEG